jgi:signal transduction histidine kinase
MSETLSVSAVLGTGPETAAPERRSDLASPRAVASLSSAFLVCILVVLAAHCMRPNGPIAILWGASGVAVAGWINGPRGREFDLAYGLLVAAAFAIGGLLVGDSLDQLLLLTLACMVEVVAAVVMIRRFTPAVGAASLDGMLKFILIAPVIAPLLSGFVAAAGVAAGGHGDFWNVLLAWWLGHGLGLAVISPLGLILARGDFGRMPSLLRMLEGGAILAALAVVQVLVYYGYHRHLGVVIVPLVFLAAARLRLPGASLALAVTTIITIAGALTTLPSELAFMHETLDDRIRILQLYLIFLCLPALPIAALLDERDRLAIVARKGQATAEAASLGKSRLLANVSHEIKSPVAGIIGIGELWSAGKLGPVTAMQQEMAEMLVRTARQVEALAYDLLDVSHAEAGSVSVSLRAVDVGAVLEDVRRTVGLRPEAAGLRIEVERGGDNLKAVADSVRLTQVITNLASNAVKYGASGGIVLFQMARPSSDRVRISVIDRGPGIPADRQVELFEPFNRLGMERSTIEGNGIGLTLAKRLIELQGGTIGFESRPGEGSRFWVELPAA